MKISTKGRYGLRVMIELAVRYNNGSVMLGTLAKRLGVSRKYLHNLLVSLKAVDLVRSMKGPGGGYMLARPPKEISAGDIVQALEGAILPVDCCNQDRSICPRDMQCAAHEVWQEVGETVQKVLDSRTLDQLAERQNALMHKELIYHI